MGFLKNYSPLRYPGGKNKLSDYVIKLIEYNNLNNATYIEPYAGGCAVALKLLLEGHVNNIIINDFDRSIFAFWHSVLYETDALCEMINNTPINMDNWYRLKALQADKENVPLLELGFSTFFLNRTNRSGIISAGVIGGYNQTGNYLMDCRFKKDKLISKIREIANHRDHIQLYNLDTIDLIQDVINNMEEQAFIFFDPPYYEKGSCLYVNYYTHDDHLALSRSIADIENHKWIVTYDNVPQIADMYEHFRSTTYNLKYTVEKKYFGTEIMFYSDNMELNQNLLQLK